jgi:hypothetical protein
MGFMNLNEIIIDSLRYSASNLKIVVLLGLVLFLADIADEISWAGEMTEELRMVLFLVIIVLTIFEAGYVFRILEDTIKGSKKLPKFNNLKLMFYHGLKELLILVIYFSTPFLLFGLFFLDFLISMDLDDVPGSSIYVFIGFLGLTTIIYIFFPAVLLHRAHNNGNFKSSFEFPQIYKKIRSVGIKRLVIVYFGIIIIVTITKLVLSDSIEGIVPVYGSFIPNLLVIPYLLIFTTRVLGLIDQP